MSADTKQCCCHKEISEIIDKSYSLSEWVFEIDCCRWDIETLKRKIQNIDSPGTLEGQKYQCEMAGLEYKLEKLLDGLFDFSNALFQRLCQYEDQE